MPGLDFYLVCYDIGDDKLRSRAARLLKTVGRRVQDSVFEVYAPRRMALSLLERLSAYLGEEDEVAFYRICKSCRRSSNTSSGRAPEELPSYLII